MIHIAYREYKNNYLHDSSPMLEGEAGGDI